MQQISSRLCIASINKLQADKAASGAVAFWRRLSGLALAFCGLLLTACASQTHWPAAASGDLPVLPDHQLLAQVPFYPQQDYQCGPAALAMMLNAQGRHTSPDALVEKVYLPGRRGSLQVEMDATARQSGLLVYPLQPDLATLLQEVAAGNPVLVMQNLRLGWWPQWHFAVVTGFDNNRDKKQQTVILNTGVHAGYQQPLSVFMATWDRADRWARVILPPDQVPATAQPLVFLQSAQDLEVTGQLAAALTAYQTAAATWPDQPAAWIGMGNVAFQRRDWPQASHYYQAMTVRFPAQAAGWNNLGESLARQGCPVAAQKAAECAHQLDPQRFSLSDTGFPALPQTNSSVSCPQMNHVRCGYNP